MTKADLQHFKQKLETELVDLTKQLESMGRQLNDKGDWMAVPEAMDQETPEFDEVADTFEKFESDIAVLNVIEARYGDLQKALERIENGTYGICSISGNPIEHDRLEANPVATTCQAHMNDQTS